MRGLVVSMLNAKDTDMAAVYDEKLQWSTCTAFESNVNH